MEKIKLKEVVNFWGREWLTAYLLNKKVEFFCIPGSYEKLKN
jgi:hypothetical protein